MSSRRIIYDASIPKRVRDAFRLAGECKTGESRLWREMAARAVLDSFDYTGESDVAKHQKIGREARRWFKFHTDLASAVFDLAQVDFRPVYQEINNFQPIELGDEQDE